MTDDPTSVPVTEEQLRAYKGVDRDGALLRLLMSDAAPVDAHPLPWTAEKMPAGAIGVPGTWWVYDSAEPPQIVASDLHEPLAQLLARRPALYSTLIGEQA